MFYFSLKIKYHAKNKTLYSYAMKKFDEYQEEDCPLYGVLYIPCGLC